MSIRPTVIIIFPLECWRYVILLLWSLLQSFLTVVLIKVCFLISGNNQMYVLFIKKVTNKLSIIADQCHYYQFHMFQLSHFDWAAPALPFLPEISHFEIIPTWMSGIYEFFRSITLFTNSIEKSWLLVTKLVACVTLGHHLHHKQ